MSRRDTPTFAELFRRPPATVADAPGRANLIGEHTDYNGGFVLPTPIPQRTRVELTPRGGRDVRVASADCGNPAEIVHYVLGEETRTGRWIDYVAGVTREVERGGLPIGGFDARIATRVPIGSGLSSSAALEVSLLRALREAFALELDDQALALTAQRAESGFVGARVGIMDQMVASLGEPGSALFLDTRTLEWEKVPLPAGVTLAVIHSGIAHDHARGDYNTRRSECERASQLLGVSELRDLTRGDLAAAANLPEPLGRRVRHVLTENDRVLEAVGALHTADLETLGALLRASHRSLRDDFEVSLPEVDLLVELAEAEPAMLGARLTGGGFGGAIVALATGEAVRPAAERVVRAYADRTGRAAAVLLPLASTEDEIE